MLAQVTATSPLEDNVQRGTTQTATATTIAFSNLSTVLSIVSNKCVKVSHNIGVR